MIWYFADDCAAEFPYRHSFQTHYQFPKELLPNDVGEQPGPRPYSRGHGPIGAPKFGILPQGDLDAFIHGVPASKLSSIPPLDCPVFVDGGLVALPPPDSFTVGDLAGFSNPDTPVFPLSKIGGVFNSFIYQAPSFESPGEPYRIEWTYGDGGMQLTLTVNDGPLGHLTTVHPSFLRLQEAPEGWRYLYTWAPGLPLPSDSVVIQVGKCIPVV